MPQLKKSLNVCKDPAEQANVLLMLGIYHLKNNQYLQAVNYLFSSVNCCADFTCSIAFNYLRALSRDSQLPEAAYAIAKIYIEHDKKNEAINFYKSAISFLEIKSQNSSNKVNSLIRKGEIYEELCEVHEENENKKKAIASYRLANEYILAKKSNDLIGKYNHCIDYSKISYKCYRLSNSLSDFFESFHVLLDVCNDYWEKVNSFVDTNNPLIAELVKNLACLSEQAHDELGKLMLKHASIIKPKLYYKGIKILILALNMPSILKGYLSLDVNSYDGIVEVAKKICDDNVINDRVYEFSYVIGKVYWNDICCFVKKIYFLGDKDYQIAKFRLEEAFNGGNRLAAYWLAKISEEKAEIDLAVFYYEEALKDCFDPRLESLEDYNKYMADAHYKLYELNGNSSLNARVFHLIQAVKYGHERSVVHLTSIILTNKNINKHIKVEIKYEASKALASFWLDKGSCNQAMPFLLELFRVDVEKSFNFLQAFIQNHLTLEVAALFVKEIIRFSEHNRLRFSDYKLLLLIQEKYQNLKEFESFTQHFCDTDEYWYNAFFKCRID